MRIIQVEGYKAFHGDMLIKPKNGKEQFCIVNKDWLYKPEFDCWYGAGQSFPAEVCEIINSDITERDE